MTRRFAVLATAVLLVSCDDAEHTKILERNGFPSTCSDLCRVERSCAIPSGSSLERSCDGERRLGAADLPARDHQIGRHIAHLAR